LQRLCRIAAAVTEGDRAVLDALNAEKHANAKMKRDINERLLASEMLPEGKNCVINADPAWRFKTWSDKGKTMTSAENHYATSDLKEIMSLDIDRIAADDRVLFLWATVPMLPEALEVMGAWGFRYVTNFCWVKHKAGTGYWNRNKHELLLVGVRGNIPAPVFGTQWESVITADVRRHSAKPEKFLEMIEAYFPHLPKIQLYRRGPARPGWSAWGAEAENTETDERRTA
jgi:N6-adenosine-specific RNA methylase IME4